VNIIADLNAEAIGLLDDSLVLAALFRLPAECHAAVVVGGHAQEESFLHARESPFSFLRIDQPMEAPVLQQERSHTDHH